jgi:hypothetical protein
VCESTPEEEIAPGGTIDVRRRVASARPDRSSVYVQIYSAEQLRKNEEKKNEMIQQSVRSIISLTAYAAVVVIIDQFILRIPSVPLFHFNPRRKPKTGRQKINQILGTRSSRLCNA